MSGLTKDHSVATVDHHATGTSWALGRSLLDAGSDHSRDDDDACVSYSDDTNRRDRCTTRVVHSSGTYHDAHCAVDGARDFRYDDDRPLDPPVSGAPHASAVIRCVAQGWSHRPARVPLCLFNPRWSDSHSTFRRRVLDDCPFRHTSQARSLSRASTTGAPSRRHRRRSHNASSRIDRRLLVIDQTAGEACPSIVEFCQFQVVNRGQCTTIFSALSSCSARACASEKAGAHGRAKD